MKLIHIPNFWTKDRKLKGTGRTQGYRQKYQLLFQSFKGTEKDR